MGALERAEIATQRIGEVCLYSSHPPIVALCSDDRCARICPSATLTIAAHHRANDRLNLDASSRSLPMSPRTLQCRTADAILCAVR